MITNLENSKLISRYPSLQACEASVIAATNGLIKVFEGGGKLIVFGNGGSACDSEHICGELQKGFLSKRVLSPEQKKNYAKVDDKISNFLQQGLPAISLSTQFATQSAFANDVDPQYCFAQQVHVLASIQDAVWGISTSGNSQNVVHAFKIAKAKNSFSIALTGEKSSLSEEFATVTIKAPSNIVYETQELHLPIYHAICLELEMYFWPEK